MILHSQPAQTLQNQALNVSDPVYIKMLHKTGDRKCISISQEENIPTTVQLQ